MTKLSALEQFERLTQKLVELSKRKPQKKPEPEHHFAIFQDRLFASAIDTTILFFLFKDWFQWLSSYIYRHANIDIESARAQSEVISSDAMAHAKYQAHLFFDSGLADLWLLNSLVQSVILGIALVLVWCFYHTTPGKYLLGIRFAGKDGEGFPTRNAYIIRYLAFYLSLPFFMIGFATLGFDKQKRAWHDKIAGTTVIYTEEGSLFYQAFEKLKAQFRRKP